MKQVIYIISLYFMCTSCSDFLDYKDNDKVIPGELDQYSELIAGELTQKYVGASCHNLWIMSDDFGTFVPSWIGDRTTDNRETYQSWYGWAKESQITPKGDEKIDPAWEHFYHKVLMCNIIERDVDEFENDPEGVKLRLLGEVQALRAMSYWYLVNMYGEPYRSAEQAKTAMGVPINKETSIKDKLYTRSTLQEVYELMEVDLKNALQNLEKGEQKHTIFRANKDVIRLFLSRIYLEQRKYDDVITVCNDALKETTRTIISVEEMLTYNSSTNPMLNKNNNSLIFSWLNRDAYPGMSVSEYSSGRYCVSEDLVALFASNDIRKYSNVSWDGNKQHIQKYRSQESGCEDMNYRVEEFYFNRAEAYIEKGEWELGMKDINEVYSRRLEEEVGHLDATNVDDARTHLRNEKRKEFCFEDMRWFDIRRWGLEVEHRFYNFSMDGTYFTYILEAESPNYVLPLPLDIQRRNFEIEQPKRVETKTK
ncbi:RagB/SusD family nutrient uptake outer membrane protein [Butyricimonas hominis]|uniref:RagB/SusD family nutrient uptake outer membrane protein n=1 Tax=Butyricimonas hominis TaxID=2763032 RepID=A0ABR7CZW8_9BACT|nr:RagB/SusD family nutrient uptake outer membrane protein [Butyricimonas hominis]MBC5621211.1 RagB/SusD family nutrient uptake outer membrane protein [Butyricimonas hominis]